MKQVIVHVAANQIRRDGTICGPLINCARLADAVAVGEYVATRIICMDDTRRDTFGHAFQPAPRFEE